MPGILERGRMEGMRPDVIEHLTRQLLRGELTPTELVRQLSQSGPADPETADLGEVQLDLDRRRRCGFPEVIYAEGKSIATIEKVIAAAVVRRRRGAGDPRCTRSGRGARGPLSRRGAQRASPASSAWDKVERGRKVVRRRMGMESSRRRGHVAVLSAGTSDLPVAEEARETADWTGARVTSVADVGVAGPHRLRERLAEFQNADAIVVVAGIEEALPSVVGGYVACPVIAVPTSVGYGANFGGLAALLSMLNSCAANVTVVNIDAGFKAGYVAGLIAARAARGA